jgi:hypothetical protein
MTTEAANKAFRQRVGLGDIQKAAKAEKKADAAQAKADAKAEADSTDE